MYLNGRNLLIYAGGEVVAAAKSCRISMDFDTIETANVIDGAARTFIPGRYEWQVSVNTLVTSVHSCFEGHGQTVRLSFVVRDRFGNLSADRMTGEAFVKKADVTGTVNSLTQGSFVFQGTGPIERILEVLRDSNQYNLLDSGGAQLRVVSDKL